MLQQFRLLKIRQREIATPFFMPDATRGFVKFLSGNDLRRIGLEAAVVNTYHLLLRPGEKFFQKTDIKQWGNWDIPLLSDSGGYQVFSLLHKNSSLGKITDKGARFRSPLDGHWIELTPEKSIQFQFDLGVDMLVVLDDPPPNTYSKDKIKKAVERTLRWARRSVQEYKRQVESRKLIEEKRPLIFAVIQGGPYIDLRRECLQGLLKIEKKEKNRWFRGWDGFGFGGRHVDEKGNLLEEVLRATAEAIPEKAWKFALGIGTPEDMVKAVEMGWEMFDCVIPTREGRHGKIFVRTDKNILVQGKPQYQTINILNQKYADDMGVVDNFCQCELCRQHNRSFLRHLFKYQDPLGMRLASLHNLKFYLDLMKELRK